MRQFSLFVFLGILISFSSCRSDFSTVPSTGSLEFSKTKIYLDTVFNNIGSSTYGLKVYNRSNSDIKIPVIQLGKGVTSKYRLMVDGMTGQDADNNGIGEGKIFNNVELLAKDSLFIFIEITNNVSTPVPTEFTYDDQILFDIGSNQQKVDLTTLIWDANFIFPNRTIPNNIKELLDINGQTTDIIGHRLTDNDFSPVGSWQFSKLKPTVIYGYALVPNGKTLTITDGASLYFHADTYSGLIIENGGKILIDGHSNYYDPTTGELLAKHEVTFEGDRLEPSFEDTPGQWGGIYIISNAAIPTPNTIKYLTLKNSTFGIYTQNVDNAGTLPNLDIQNTKIFNSSAFGMLNRNTNVLGKNLVINYSGQANNACLNGGVYNFNHCTFNNDWLSSSQRALILNNYEIINNIPQPTITMNSIFENCVIYSSNNQIAVKIDVLGSYIPVFKNCLFKFNETNITLPNSTKYEDIRSNLQGNKKNIDPKFKNAAKNKLQPQTITSGAYQGANSNSNFPDILEQLSTNSHIGAYQVIP